MVHLLLSEHVYTLHLLGNAGMKKCGPIYMNAAGIQSKNAGSDVHQM